MRFSCVITYRSSRNSEISVWKTDLIGSSHVEVVEGAIAALRRRQKRALTIVGVNVYHRDAVSS